MKKIFTFLVIIVIATSPVFAQNSLIENVPYFYQYDNYNNPGGTCQITAMAMVLKAYGASTVTPDIIYNRYNYENAKAPAGWASMFNSEAVRYGLSVRASGTTRGSAPQMRSLLAEGKPVPVFGYFTYGGHIVLTLGYDGSNYTIHDSVGKYQNSKKPEERKTLKVRLTFYRQLTCCCTAV